MTPTDLREYKHYLDETLELKPQTINRKLSSLRSFLNWAGIEGYFPDNRLLHVPQPIKEQASAPKWEVNFFGYLRIGYIPVTKYPFQHISCLLKKVNSSSGVSPALMASDQDIYPLT
ncbi:MAG: hypothetical protein GDA48_04370 [Hormoscilla sp. GM102CHS1]|nr:hypothetical protein [Hormoscilla sp. GM102CHS1]